MLSSPVRTHETQTNCYVLAVTSVLDDWERVTSKPVKRPFSIFEEPVAALCRKRESTEMSFHLWRNNSFCCTSALWHKRLTRKCSLANSFFMCMQTVPYVHIDMQAWTLKVISMFRQSLYFCVKTFVMVITVCFIRFARCWLKVKARLTILHHRCVFRKASPEQVMDTIFQIDHPKSINSRPQTELY